MDLGSACHNVPLQGLSHGLNAKRESCKLGDPYLSGINGSCRATVPGQYFWNFFHFSGPEEFLLGILASHSQSELPPGQLLPTQCRWPSLCSHLGQLVRLVTTLVTSPPLPTSLPPLLSSPTHSGLERFPLLALGGLPVLGILVWSAPPHWP